MSEHDLYNPHAEPDKVKHISPVKRAPKKSTTTKPKRENKLLSAIGWILFIIAFIFYLYATGFFVVI